MTLPGSQHGRIRSYIGFNSDPLSTGQNFVETTDWHRQPGIQAVRGRSEETGRYEAGTASAHYENRQNAFHPLLGSTFSPNIQIGKQLYMEGEYPWLPGMLPDGGFYQGQIVGFHTDVGSALSVVPSGTGLLSYAGLPHHGRVVSAGAGTSDIITDYLPATAGVSYAASVRTAAGGFPRSQQLLLAFLNGSGGVVGSYTNTVTNVNGAWTSNRVGGSAPAGTTQVTAICYFLGTVAGETQYVAAFVLDAASFTVEHAPLWTGFVDSIHNRRAGLDAVAEVGATDALGLFGIKQLRNDNYKSLLLSMSPTVWHRLNEPKIASPNKGNSNPFISDSSGLGTLHPGTVVGPVERGVEGPLINDPATAFSLSESTAQRSTQTGASQSLGTIITAGVSVPSSTGPWTINLWARQKDIETAAAPGGSTKTNGMLLFIGTDHAVTSPIIQLGVGGSVFSGYSGVVGDGATLNVPNDSTGRPEIFDEYWHMFTVERNGPSFSLFIDGNAIGAIGLINNFSFPFGVKTLIGNAPEGTVQFEGEIADFSTFSGAYSASTLQSLYARGRGNFGYSSISVRMGAALDAISWPSSLRNIDPGIGACQEPKETLAETYALEHMQDVEATDGGHLFMSPDNKVRFISRLNYDSTQIGGTFGIGAGEISFVGDDELWDDKLLQNQVLVTSPFAQEAIAEDVGSQTAYGLRSVSYSTLGPTQSQGAATAAYWLGRYAAMVPRLENITIPMTGNDDAFNFRLNTLAGTRLCEVGNRVAIRQRPPGYPNGAHDFYVEYHLHIEGIEDHFDAGDWTVTLHLGAPYSAPTVFGPS